MSEKNRRPESEDVIAPQQSGTKNIISEKETTLREALDYQREHGGRLGYNLVNLRLGSDDMITAVLSRQHGIPSVNLELFQIDEHVLQLIPQEVAQKYSVFPLSRVGASLTLAMVDPTNVLAMDDIKFMTGLNIKPVVVAEASIRQAIAKFYGTSREIQLSSPPQQSGTIPSLSESDKNMVEEIVQSTLMGLYHVPSSPIGDTLPLSPHSGIVDSTGNPIEPLRARDVSEPLIGKSREDLNIITIPASDFEKLSAKTAAILKEAELTYERIAKDQEETERLKMETREMLALLRAA